MTQLVEIGDTETPEAVFDTVKSLFLKFYPEESFVFIQATLNDFLALFTGKYPGYRSCNTRYHDLVHTLDAVLAFSRLLDGYNLSQLPLTAEKAAVGIDSAVLHDSGYIQGREDTTGTGAKYTLNHVERSIDFIGEYLKEKGAYDTYFQSARSIVACTGLRVDQSGISFPEIERRMSVVRLET